MTRGILLIGCGAMARVHGMSIRDLSQVRRVAAVDTNPERAELQKRVSDAH